MNARNSFTRRLLAAALTATSVMGIVSSTASADLTITPGSFIADVRASDDSYYLQAGGHPHEASSAVSFDLTPSLRSDGSPRSVEVILPAGFVGNPQAVVTCSRGVFNRLPEATCPNSSQIGFAEISVDPYDNPPPVGDGVPALLPVYNLPPRPGVAAEFGISVSGVPVHLEAGVTKDGTHRISVAAGSISQGLSVFRQKVTLWGNPNDPAHDSMRSCGVGVILGQGPSCPPERTTTAFLTNPTSCAGPQTSVLKVRPWADANIWLEDTHTPPVGTNGCASVPFDPSIAVAPSSRRADSPTGLDVTIEVPQSNEMDTIASSHLKDTVVRFPAGMEINPAAGDGLAGCTMAEIGLTSTSPVQFNGAKASCPDSSRIGTVEIDSPLLDHTIEGVVYQGKPDDPSAPGAENPFDSLLALYVEVDDPESGTRFKLASKVVAKDGDGRLVSTFADSPQLPFNSFELHLDGGEQAPLVTPATCGTYVTEAVLTGWSGAQRTLSPEFTIDRGPNGGPCPAGRPFDVGFRGGLLDGTAGSSSPFVLQLTRADGNQEISSFSVDLPPGLTSKLAGIPYCPEAALASVSGTVGSGAAQIAAPSCPAASQVGTATIGTGAGANPLYVETGKAYLAGPYKGAPLSLAVITPAVAGPFDLGSVLVRSKVEIDRDDAQVHVATDPLPQVLHGIPLRMRDIRVRMDRPGFMQAPTNCSQMQLAAQVTSVLGAVSPETQRFQVGDCATLGFRPKLSLRLKGKTKRTGHPALTAVLTQPTSGQANIGRVSVVLPRAQFIDQSRIGDVCTRPQFAANACPANSVLGKATAYTPLLEQPLTGIVYLRANGGERELPDMVAALRGQIDVDLVGFIDSVKKNPKSDVARIRNTFAIVPDAPVSKFVLQLNAGKKALLVNSQNLCASPQRATVKVAGQNGKVHNFNPLVKNDCGAKAKAGKR